MSAKLRHDCEPAKACGELESSALRRCRHPKLHRMPSPTATGQHWQSLVSRLSYPRWAGGIYLQPPNSHSRFLPCRSQVLHDAKPQQGQTVHHGKPFDKVQGHDPHQAHHHVGSPKTEHKVQPKQHPTRPPGWLGRPATNKNRQWKPHWAHPHGNNPPTTEPYKEQHPTTEAKQGEWAEKEPIRVKPRHRAKVQGAAQHQGQVWYASSGCWGKHSSGAARSQAGHTTYMSHRLHSSGHVHLVWRDRLRG